MIQPVGLFAQSTGAVTTEPNGNLGKDDFLKMLVTQMRYQDPLNPMDNTQMMAQMAQFSQLEQMLNMTKSFTMMQGVSMLGRNILATATDGSQITGKVVVVMPDGEMPMLRLDTGAIVALRDVEQVAF